MEKEYSFSAVGQAKEFYEEAKGLTGNNPVAASILTHALVVASFHDSFSHELCMGIKHGLEGWDCSINSSLDEIAKAIDYIGLPFPSEEQQSDDPAVDKEATQEEPEKK